MDYFEEYGSMVAQIAGEYKRKYSIVERKDVEQQLWLWFVEHPRKLKEWQEEHKGKDLDRLIAKSLRNQAYDYCVKEKASKEGYSTDDLFWYTKEFIKMLIPSVLADDWDKMESIRPSGSKSHRPPSESGDWMAYGADIKSAFDKLNEQEQNLVFLFYATNVNGDQLHEVAEDQRGTAKATAMAANRALNKMVRSLGGFPPYRDEDYSEQPNV